MVLNNCIQWAATVVLLSVIIWHAVVVEALQLRRGMLQYGEQGASSATDGDRSASPESTHGDRTLGASEKKTRHKTADLLARRRLEGLYVETPRQNVASRVFPMRKSAWKLKWVGVRQIDGYAGTPSTC